MEDVSVFVMAQVKPSQVRRTILEWLISMSVRLRSWLWMRWLACWTGRGREVRSCCAACWIRRGRSGFQDRAPLSLTAMVRGHAWVTPEHGDPVRVGPGDVVINRGPDKYTFADDLATAPQAVIHPGGQGVSPGGVELAETMGLGVRTWGNSFDGSVIFLNGTYQMEGEVSQRLLRVLPVLLVLRADEWSSPLVSLLGAEIVKDEPGQEAVLDRLLDLLLIEVLRAWFARPEAAVPAWYRGYADPVVGRALRLLQRNPAYPWTVAALASAAGVSRAALARRFTDLVGEPPMAFLTGWRLALGRRPAA
jgi:hypothetical protein